MRNGFTFIEIMTVVSIISIMSFFALPVINHSLQYIELNNVAINLQADLRWIQQMAMNEQVTQGRFQLVFDINSLNKYLITDGTVVLKKVQFPVAVHLPYQPIPATIYFQASGAPNRGGQTIPLTNSRKEIYVIIEGAVGRVRISETRP